MLDMKRYAGGTKVGVARSRNQIDNLLRDFGATGIQWTNEWTPVKHATLRFTWIHEGVHLMAKIRMVCDHKLISKNAIDGRSGNVSNAKLEKLLSQWDSEAHRLLLLFLKGAFFAIEAGMISAEQIFLPFFEDNSGRTVWEIMQPRLIELPQASAARLLTEKAGE